MALVELSQSKDNELAFADFTRFIHETPEAVAAAVRALAEEKIALLAVGKRLARHDQLQEKKRAQEFMALDPPAQVRAVERSAQVAMAARPALEQFMMSQGGQVEPEASMQFKLSLPSLGINETSVFHLEQATVPMVDRHTYTREAQRRGPGEPLVGVQPLPPVYLVNDSLGSVLTPQNQGRHELSYTGVLPQLSDGERLALFAMTEALPHMAAQQSAFTSVDRSHFI